MLRGKKSPRFGEPMLGFPVSRNPAVSNLNATELLASKLTHLTRFWKAQAPTCFPSIAEKSSNRIFLKMLDRGSAVLTIVGTQYVHARKACIYMYVSWVAVCTCAYIYNMYTEVHIIHPHIYLRVHVFMLLFTPWTPPPPPGWRKWV